MKYKKILTWVNAFLMLFFLSSCSEKNSEFDIAPGKVSYTKYNKDTIISNNGPSKGGTLKIFSTTPDTLNPILTRNIYIKDISNLIFESLVKIDGSQKPIPMLAESWKISEDKLTWTFYLKKNITWHDGIPFTSEDVEFTLESIFSANSNSIYKKDVQNISSFSAIDPLTFKISLYKPNSFTAECMSFPIIAKHYFLGEDVFTSNRNMLPMGTGPYKFESYNNKEIILKCFQNWWMKNIKNNKPDNNVPYIENIQVIVKSDKNQEFNEFQTKNIDVYSVDTKDWSKFFGRTDITLRKFCSRDYEYLTINFQSKYLKDKAIRQAILYSIDKNKLANELLPGEVNIADIPVMPESWAYDASLNCTADKYKARQILKTAGWAEEDGSFYKIIDGKKTNLEIEITINNENENRLKIAKKMCEQLKAGGINLIINKVSYEQQLEKIKNKDFDIALIGCKVPLLPDISFMYASNNIASGFNTSCYSNATVDDTLQKIAFEYDIDTRKELYSYARNIINDEVPYIGLFFYNKAIAVNKRVIGGNSLPTFWDKFYKIKDWYIIKNTTD